MQRKERDRMHKVSILLLSHNLVTVLCRVYKYRVSNLKYESVRIDSKTVVFIRANLVKKKPTEGSGSNINFIRKQCTFPEVVSPTKWYVTNIKPWA